MRPDANGDDVGADEFPAPPVRRLRDNPIVRTAKFALVGALYGGMAAAAYGVLACALDTIREGLGWQGMMLSPLYIMLGVQFGSIDGLLAGFVLGVFARYPIAWPVLGGIVVAAVNVSEVPTTLTALSYGAPQYNFIVGAVIPPFIAFGVFLAWAIDWLRDSPSLPLMAWLRPKEGSSLR